ADFGITGAKNEGLVFSRGKPLRKVPQDQLVDVLFEEIDKYATAKRVEVDEAESAEGAEWLAEIEAENAGELTPERIAAMEAEDAHGGAQRPAHDHELADLARRRAERGGPAHDALHAVPGLHAALPQRAQRPVEAAAEVRLGVPGRQRVAEVHLHEDQVTGEAQRDQREPERVASQRVARPPAGARSAGLGVRPRAVEVERQQDGRQQPAGVP